MAKRQPLSLHPPCFTPHACCQVLLSSMAFMFPLTKARRPSLLAAPTLTPSCRWCLSVDSRLAAALSSHGMQVAVSHSDQRQASQVRYSYRIFLPLAPKSPLISGCCLTSWFIVGLGLFTALLAPVQFYAGFSSITTHIALGFLVYHAHQAPRFSLTPSRTPAPA